MATSPRVSAKAIIIRNQHLLVIVNHNQNGEWFCLPGGGQEKQESLPEALKRECFEEIGVQVQVGSLWFVRDYISKNHEFAASNPEFCAVELMFECWLEHDAEPRSGSNPDDLQIGVRWIPLIGLEQQALYPKALTRALQGAERGIYLGDVN
ncbi:MAG: hypothetical protein RLZZ156_2575 [Deinococcota bacterium]|jgi:8-oxo-dGTP diphosphatase